MENDSEQKKKMMAYEELQKSLIDDMKKSKICYHYTARSDTCYEAIEAINHLYKRRERVINLKIESSMLGDTDIDFWSPLTIQELISIWEEEAYKDDYWRLMKTLKEVSD